MSDGGEEERDEIEVNGVRRLSALHGDIFEVWPRRVRGEELENARAGWWREWGRRVPANAVHDGESIRGCRLGARGAAGEARCDGVMAWIASSGERLCVSIWAARFTAHALVLAPPPPSSATPRCRAAVNEWSRCIGGM